MNAKVLSVALGFITLLFVSFVWWVFAAAGGKMHWAIPVACTVGPLLLVLLLWWLQRAAAKRAAANLEEALREDGARQQRQAGQSSAEVVRLRSEFDRAVAALRSSKLGSRDGNAGDALYRLPWYTIIGPPASGKTTVLRNSGLKFPYLPGTGDRLKGVGGTRNCDWWLTNHAILLDTAGRWTLEDDDRDEWLAFLDLLKRHRGKRPLNGVIAAVSVAGDEATSISSLSVAEVQTLATTMRERLDEITGQLGLALPVYLMFTKCDLIPGFVETFGALSSEERRQVWGFTTPLLGGAGDPGSHLGTEFDALMDSLERHVVTRLSQEVEQVVIPQIYDFPAQLGALREKLVTFADTFFEQSAFGETPFMRGVYFTSGTQEGAPSDLLLRDVADRLNVRPQPSEPRGEKKSYFLYDMLMNVVFEDRGIATASQHELLRQRRRRRIVSSSLFAFAAITAGLPTLSCKHNLDSISRTRDVVAASLQAGPVPPGVDLPQQLPELLALRTETERYQGGLPAKIASFGLFPGEDIRGPLMRYYGLSLKERVVRPLLNRSNERLITMTRQYEALRKQGHATIALNEQASASLRAALKLHLLLAAPRDPCTPPLAKRADWVSSRLKSLWTQASPGAQPADAAEHGILVSQYLELSESFPELSFGRDERSIQLARAALSNDDKASRLLEAALEKFSEDPKDLQRLAGASMWVHDQVTVPDAFTRDAWTRIAEEINSPQNWSFGDEDWVLGCNQVAPEQLSEKQSQSFEREYLKRYATEWQSFVQGLSARQPSNLDDAANVLVEYVSRPGVLGRLFQVVKDNTDLPPAPTGPQDVLLGALTNNAKSVVSGKGKVLSDGVQAAMPRERKSPERERIQKAFADFASFGVPAREGVETPLEQYRRQIEPVLTALRGYKADPNRLEALATATRTALDNVDLLLASHGGAHSEKLRELLLPPLTGIASIVFNDRGTQVERKWCELVYRPFQQELAGRFPFEPDANEAVSLQTFSRFFQPGTGVVWNFVNTQLAGYVSQEGSRYRFGSADGADARALFRDELLGFLAHAQQVRDAFFPYGATAPRMPFRIRVRGAPGFSMTSFKVGANTVRYDSGEERWVSAEWPGDQPGLGASLAVTPYQGQGPRPLTLDGEWGLFMILDPRFGASVLERTGRQMTVGWKPKGGLHWIKVDFASDDPHSPILKAPFGDSDSALLPLSVPARIAHHGAGC